jgi:8-amino-7-oxononanoate synthase
MDFGNLETIQLPGRTLDLAGKEYLYFSGTAYLDISRNKQFQERLREAISRYGTNYSGSRNSNQSTK